MNSWRAAAAAAYLGLGLLLPATAAAANDVESGTPLATLVGRIEGAAMQPTPRRAPVEPAAIEAEIEALVAGFKAGPPSYRRARKLHRVLHRDHLRWYDPGADSLSSVVSRGRFNCLSATLFYGLAARELGFAPRVVETPGHVYLRLTLGNGREIDVESTDRYGFDVLARDLSYVHPSREGGLDGWAWMPGIALASANAGHPHTFSLEGALPFLWLNTAGRALHAGAVVRAAEAALQAYRLLPEDDPHDGAIQHVIRRAFAQTYQRGEFEAALAVARIDVEMYPDDTVTGDRLVAAATKLIELRCEQALPGAAWTLLARTAPLLSPLQRARFERTAYRGIATAAVRVNAWELARRAVRGYARAEPDPVESQQLRAWVESRQRGDAATDPATFGGEATTR